MEKFRFHILQTDRHCGPRKSGRVVQTHNSSELSWQKCFHVQNNKCNGHWNGNAVQCSSSDATGHNIYIFFHNTKNYQKNRPCTEQRSGSALCTCLHMWMCLPAYSALQQGWGVLFGSDVRVGPVYGQCHQWNWGNHLSGSERLQVWPLLCLSTRWAWKLQPEKRPTSAPLPCTQHRSYSRKHQSLMGNQITHEWPDRNYQIADNKLYMTRPFSHWVLQELFGIWDRHTHFMWAVFISRLISAQSCCSQCVTPDLGSGSPVGTTPTCWWICWPGIRTGPGTTAPVPTAYCVNLMGENKHIFILTSSAKYLNITYQYLN